MRSIEKSGTHGCHTLPGIVFRSASGGKKQATKKFKSASGKKKEKHPLRKGPSQTEANVRRPFFWRRGARCGTAGAAPRSPPPPSARAAAAGRPWPKRARRVVPEASFLAARGSPRCPFGANRWIVLIYDETPGKPGKPIYSSTRTPNKDTYGEVLLPC